ncbi:MAG: hypothetical protein H8D23_06965 [Candidatus Brocadiales bacterium]|nr:hypothetical protein [Candidatus Brocadiales bacterium]
MKLRFRPLFTILIIMLVVVAGLYSLGIDKGTFAQGTTGGASTNFGTETSCVGTIQVPPYPVKEPKYPWYPNGPSKIIVSPFYKFFVDNIANFGSETNFIGSEMDFGSFENGTETPFCVPRSLAGVVASNNEQGSVDVGEFRILEENGNCPAEFIWIDYNENGIKDAGECWKGMTVTDGDVGIGTDAPSEKLEVNGNVKADSFIGDGSQLTGISGGVTPEEVLIMQEQILLMQGQIQALMDEVQILRECCSGNDDDSSSGHKKKKKKRHGSDDDSRSGHRKKK